MWLCKYTGRHYITFWYIWVFFAAPVAVLEISIIMGTLCLGTFNRVWEGSCGTRSGSCFCLLMNTPRQYAHVRVHITPYAHTGCWTNWIKHDIALTNPMHKEQATLTNSCVCACVRVPARVSVARHTSSKGWGELKCASDTIITRQKIPKRGCQSLNGICCQIFRIGNRKFNAPSEAEVPVRH